MANDAGIVLNNAKERVAFELMYKIAAFEKIDTSAPRRYWLELYDLCLQAVHDRYRADRELQERPKTSE